MSTFRNAQSQAHPTKTNTLLLGVMCVLILIVSMQIWLLTAALNSALEGEGSLKWPAFWASLALFGSGAALLRYLPAPIRIAVRAEAHEAFPQAALAWRTLAISAVSLALAFAVWFMWSVIPVRLKDAGFTFTRQQLFWLTSTPVILGSLLRIPYGLIVSRFGSRRSYAAVTLLLLLPCIATAIALRKPGAASFEVLLACAALTGIAGANFATSMGVVNLWFPKQKQGTALGINGLGNLGVTIAQFSIPAVIAISLTGEPSHIAAKPLHLENAALIWIPFILICSAAIWFGTRDHDSPPKTLASQLVAGKRMHTWVLSLLYFLTFGCFVAMGASLPLIIKEVFANAPGGAPSPLLFAPWAAAIATIMRPIGGWLADKFGAGRITTIAIGTMALGGFSLSGFLDAHQFGGFFTIIMIICAAAGLGNGSIFKIIPHVLPKEAAAAIGIVSCLGAFGGFIPPLLLGWTMDRLGGPAWAYTGMALFAVVCFAVNGWYYHRRTSPSHC